MVFCFQLRATHLLSCLALFERPNKNLAILLNTPVKHSVPFAIHASVLPPTSLIFNKENLATEVITVCRQMKVPAPRTSWITNS